MDWKPIIFFSTCISTEAFVPTRSLDYTNRNHKAIQPRYPGLLLETQYPSPLMPPQVQNPFILSKPFIIPLPEKSHSDIMPPLQAHPLMPFDFSLPQHLLWCFDIPANKKKRKFDLCLGYKGEIFCPKGGKISLQWNFKKTEKNEPRFCISFPTEMTIYNAMQNPIVDFVLNLKLKEFYLLDRQAYVKGSIKIANLPIYNIKKKLKPLGPWDLIVSIFQVFRCFFSLGKAKMPRFLR